MRVATFNLLSGKTPEDGLVRVDRLIDAVKSLDADILGLQEVDVGQERSARLDLTAIAAEAMGAVAWRFEPTLIGAPSDPWRRAHPGESFSSAYGISVLSRFPVRSWHAIRLPYTPMNSPIVLPGTGDLIFTRDEPRMALAAVVETTAGVLTVVNTHLSFLPGWNVRQLRRLVHAVDELAQPAIIMGDLNMPGRLPSVVSHWHAAVSACTWPAHRPVAQLDHILVSPGGPAVAGGGTMRLPLSDHVAMYADVGDVRTPPAGPERPPPRGWST
ncbi:MAG: Endonuclease/exonuclease/phosphatase [Frankiales bacterium]|nr:Endonuclease/exonuclease/phosphatase [Frankiales bacterium]